MPDCIFCKIISREIPSDIVYEDDEALAFMDIRPVSKGHTLLVPKKHSDDLLTSEDEVLKSLMPKVRKLAQAVMDAVSAQGINVSTNHGRAAGQMVFHLHFHLIPRFENDGLKPWSHHDSEPKTRQEIAEQIKKHLS